MSANQLRARSAARSAARWCAARSAGCCGAKSSDVRGATRAEISLVASAARLVVPGLLHRADRRRARSGDFRQRQDQGLSALVLGRAAGAARARPLSERSRKAVRVHLSATAGGLAGDPILVRQDSALSLPVAAQCGGL